LQSRFELFSIEIEADVVPASVIPYSTNIKLGSAKIDQISWFNLADPNFSSIVNIDIILDAEYYGKVLCNESRTVEEFDVRLTRFGWTVAGPSKTDEKSSFHISCFATNTLTIQEINENLERFWAIEEPTTKFNSEELECVCHFENTYKIGDDGKFVV